MISKLETAVRLAASRLTVFLAGVPIAAAGCGGQDGPKGLMLIPVEGRVSINGTPVKSGVVTLIPDRSRGNNTQFLSSGEIAADGTYRIQTDGKPGAEPGDYKVVVVNSMRNPTKRIAINSRYNNPDTSKLSIQVAAEAPKGAYDVDLRD